MPCGDGNFTHIQFSTDDVSIFKRVISSEERNILLGFVGGETGGDPIVQGFQNPLGSDFSQITNKITDSSQLITDAIASAVPESDHERDLIDLRWTLGLSGDAGDESFITQLDNFKDHTNRISGTNLEARADGLPNIAGVAGIASAFTDAKSMMSAAGSPVEDNFSQMFGSIAGGGQLLAKNGASIIDTISAESLSDPTTVSNLIASVEDIGNKFCIAESLDIEAYDDAGKYLNKLSVGQYAISMNQSSNFNKVLGDLVTKPDLKEKIQNIPQPELPNIGMGSEYKIPEIPEL